jgi:eukaryotic-like serine/threonine-protein kinase
VAVLPRVGWGLAAAGVCAWLASPEAGREGTALVLAAALAPTPLLLPRAGLMWSVPALAPLLGAVALAPAFVGVAGLSSTLWRRAGLACSGLIWVVAGEVLTGRSLLFGAPDGVLARQEWQGSITGAASHALGPVLSSPALAPLVVWVVFAAVLPLVLRGRFLVLDLVAAGLWAAGLAVAHAGLGDVLASATPLGQARGGIAGSLLGAAVAVGVAAAVAPEPGGRAQPAPAT